MHVLWLLLTDKSWKQNVVFFVRCRSAQNDQSSNFLSYSRCWKFRVLEEAFKSTSPNGFRTEKAKNVLHHLVPACFFKKSGPIPVSFLSSSNYNFNHQIEKGVDGVLVIRTHGRKMVGADKTTQLWWPHVFALNILFAQITKVFKFWMIEIVFVGDTKS